MSQPAWDEHAAWWQREFTGGVDPEYEEQIIPLAVAHLPEATRVLDIGTGEGQVARVVADATGATVVGLVLPDVMRMRLNFATGVLYDTLPGWREVMHLDLPAKAAALGDPAVRSRLR